MFTTNEINRHIDKKYFTVLGQNAFTITLQSKNTKHCWHLLDRTYKNHSSVAILHTRTYGTEYNMHGTAHNLEQAVMQIKHHDDFQLTKRQNARRPRVS